MSIMSTFNISDEVDIGWIWAGQEFKGTGVIVDIKPTWIEVVLLEPAVSATLRYKAGRKIYINPEKDQIALKDVLVTV